MVEANSTFSGLGLRALHVGRQKIPVVRTQAKNNPSNDRSRSTSARYISAGVGSNIMSRRIRVRPYCALPEIGRAITCGSSLFGRKGLPRSMIRETLSLEVFPMKMNRVPAVAVAALLALSAVAIRMDVRAQEPKPTVKIPEAGVPQVMTIEGLFVRAA